jgi:acetolactate decarboxylase
MGKRLLNALLQGAYDGFISVGTFDTLDGEMIMLDGVVHKAKTDGTDDVLVPSAVVTPFVADILDTQTGELLAIEELKTRLNAGISQTTGDFNRFYGAKVSGTFSLLCGRDQPARLAFALPF